MGEIFTPPTVFYIISMAAFFGIGTAYGMDRERSIRRREEDH